MRKGWGLLSVTPELLTSELLSQLRFNNGTTCKNRKNFPNSYNYSLLFLKKQ